MSGLFSALSTSSSALGVFSKALGAEQQNIANSATPGYAAQRVRITDGSSSSVSSADRVQISTASDTYADAIVRFSSSGGGEAGAQTQVLGSLNQLFDVTGNTGVLSAFQQFSTSFSQLSVSPSDSTLRSTAISSAGQVAQSFQSLVKGLDTQRQQVDTQITSTVQQINDLSGQIAQLNSGIRAGRPQDANLRQALDQLSNLVDINVSTNSDGTVSVLAGGQVQLVAGDRNYAISAQGLSSNPVGGGLGQVTIQSSVGQANTSFSGTLGGLLAVRNNVLPGLLGGNGQAGTVNTLATSFASRVNSILTSAQTSSTPGAALGSPLFSYDTTDPTDAARSLTALTLTPDQLGVATVANAGAGVTGSANGAVLALAGLPSSTAAADSVGGVPAQSFFSKIASDIGQQVNTQTASQQQFQTSLASAQSSRQQSIGVSLDQEAVSVIAYQRAYEASAQVVTTLNQLTQDEVNILK